MIDFLESLSAQKNREAVTGGRIESKKKSFAIWKTVFVGCVFVDLWIKTLDKQSSFPLQELQIIGSLFQGRYAERPQITEWVGLEHSNRLSCFKFYMYPLIPD